MVAYLGMRPCSYRQLLAGEAHILSTHVAFLEEELVATNVAVEVDGALVI